MVTPAQLAQFALNIAKPIQDGIVQGSGPSEKTAIHDLAAAVILLAEAVIGSTPSTTNIGTNYGTAVPTTTSVSTRTR